MSDCLFCKIVLGEVPSDLVYQDEWAVAFRDIQPQASTHVLVVPRKHVSGPGDIHEEDEQLFGHVMRVAARVASQEGVGDSGYRLVINSGEDAMQSVRHLHIHVIGGRKMGWPPG